MAYKYNLSISLGKTKPINKLDKFWSSNLQKKLLTNLFLLFSYLTIMMYMPFGFSAAPYIPPPSFFEPDKVQLISQHKETVTAKEDGFYEFRSEENKLLAKHKHPYFTTNLSYEKRQVDPQENKYSEGGTQPDFTVESSTGIDGHTFNLNLGKLHRFGGNKTNFYTGYGAMLQYDQFDLSQAAPIGVLLNPINSIKTMYGGFYLQMGLLSTFNKKLYGNSQFYLAALVGQDKYTIPADYAWLFPTAISVDLLNPNAINEKNLSYTAQAGFVIDHDLRKYSLLTLAVKAQGNVAGLWRPTELTFNNALWVTLAHPIFGGDTIAVKTDIQLICNINAELAFKFNLSPRFYYSISPGYQYDCPNKIKYKVSLTGSAGDAMITSTATKKDDTGFMLTSEIALLESVIHHNRFRLRYAQTPQTKKIELYYQYRFK